MNPIKIASLKLDSIIYGVGGSTFLLLPVWAAIFDLRPQDMAWSSLIDISLTTFLFSLIYIGITCLNKFWRQIAYVPLLIVFCLLGYDALTYINDSLRSELILFDFLHENKSILRVLRISIPLVVLSLIIFGRIKLLTLTKSAAKIFGIFFIVMVLQFVYSKKTNKEIIFEQKEVTYRQRPVIVIIFDELDADILESKKEQLPGFKSLTERSRISGSVFPPSNYTHISLPAMLLGAPISGSSFAGNSIFFTTKADSRIKSLSQADHLFAGVNPSSISLLGWHLPYCGFFKKIERCMDATGYGVPGENISTVEWLYGNSSLLFNYRYKDNIKNFDNIDKYADLLFNDPRNFRRKNVGRLLNEMERRLIDDIGSGKYQLIFAHLPCPHLPRIDSEKSKGMLKDYVDNLVRCDRIMESITHVIDRDLGGSARMIVTSDHWLRSLDWIRNGHPNELPKAPQQVPFFYFDGESNTTPIKISGGNNVVLSIIVKKLLEENFVKLDSLLSIIQSYGSEITVLDKF